jgi:cell wall-associated NlpC family hydrolase
VQYVPSVDLEPVVIGGVFAAAGAGAVLVAAVGMSMLGGAATSAAPTGLYEGPLNAGVVPDPSLLPWVERAGALCAEFPPAVIAAQVQQESGWDPTVTSAVGAQGLSQFMPGTWPTWAQDDDSTGNISPFNPRDSLMAQGRYDCALATALAPLAGVTGVSTLSLALAGYNAGQAAVEQYQGIPPYPETQDYVRSVEALAATYVATPPGQAGSAFGTEVVAAATSQLGLPYVWGGGNVEGPTGGGFDCSGLVLYAVYQASGGQLRLPHSSAMQATMGQQIVPADMVPGDAIAFALDGTGIADHIGLYVGNNQMVTAPHNGDVVRVETLSDYWLSKLVSIRRFG